MRAAMNRSLRRLRFLFRQDSFGRELEEEMLLHIELRPASFASRAPISRFQKRGIWNRKIYRAGESGGSSL